MYGPLLIVKRYVVQPRHGNLYCHGTTRYIDTPEGVRKGRTFSRTFRCVCGEALLDRDLVLQGDDGRMLAVHTNCEELI